MIVNLDNYLEQCPDKCRHAEIVVAHDALMTVNGVTEVNVVVTCEYCEICKHRKTEAE